MTRPATLLSCLARHGAAALVGLLTGCAAGIGPPEALVDPLAGDSLFAAASLPSFDEGHLTGSPFSRDGTTREEAAIDAVSSGVRASNALGLGLDAVSEDSRGLSALDQFVFVPFRSRRGAAVELVDEEIDGVRVQGTRTYDPDNPDGPEVERYHATAPGTDLQMVIVWAPPDRLTLAVEGYDTEDGQRVTFKLLDEALVDEATDWCRGRLRVEAWRSDGSLMYAADSAYEGPLDSDAGTLTGRDIWVDRDGFWVASTFDLALAEDGSATGRIAFTASDGTALTLVLTADAVGGEVRDEAGDLVATLTTDEQGALVLLDPAGQPLRDETGEVITWDLEFEAAAR